MGWVANLIFKATWAETCKLANLIVKAVKWVRQMGCSVGEEELAYVDYITLRGATWFSLILGTGEIGLLSCAQGVCFPKVAIF